MSEELVVKEKQKAIVSLTPKDVRDQVNLIQEVMKSVMKKGEHYGIIPGCEKPSLLKPGAEKLNLTFRLAPFYSKEAGCIEEKDFISFTIKCLICSQETGKELGAGLGSCNSRETKYSTRAVPVWKATDDDKSMGQKQTRKKKDGKEYVVYIVHQNPWNIHNTLLKMACKRALVAAVLNVTAASDIFTQDIEDMDLGDTEEAREEKEEVKADKDSGEGKVSQDDYEAFCKTCENLGLLTPKSRNEILRKFVMKTEKATEIQRFYKLSKNELYNEVYDELEKLRG